MFCGIMALIMLFSLFFGGNANNFPKNLCENNKNKKYMR